ncbi:TPA_asm: P overlapped [Primula alphacytorhabdovirus 2]|nr:TPA_asm: P overlapped [Primula alphacytorhabdovirus 2]
MQFTDIYNFISLVIFIIQGLWLILTKLVKTVPYWISVPFLSLCCLSIWSTVMTMWQLVLISLQIVRWLKQFLLILFRFARNR